MPYLSKTDPQTFQDYLKDASNYSGKAERVLIPASEAEVIEICKDAVRTKTPLTVSGNRTGLTGGAIPSRGWIVSLEKLTALGAIQSGNDKKTAELTVGAGRLLADVHRLCAGQNWLYPPDPTEWNAAVGGTVSTNASGSRYYKYGATRDYILALRMILSSGDVISVKRGERYAAKDGTFEFVTESGKKISGTLPTYHMPKVKHAAGYFVKPGMDLIDLLIGSEGTLGIVTEVTLRLIPAPEKLLSGIAFFISEEDSWKFVKTLEPLRGKKETSFSVRALEYFDTPSLDFLRPTHANVPAEARAAVWYEAETSTKKETAAFNDLFDLLECGMELGDSWFNESPGDEDAFRAFRHALPVAVNERVTRAGFRKIATDFAVPMAALPDMMETYKTLSVRAKIPYLIFGHIGDGHLHWNLLPENKADVDRAWGLYKEAAAKAIALGGTISAEHGIGKIKVPYLEMLYGARAIKEMAALKRAFDPPGILGRGNIFLESLLS